MTSIEDRLKEYVLFLEKCSKMKAETIVHNDIVEMCSYMFWPSARAAHRFKKSKIDERQLDIFVKELKTFCSHVKASIDYAYLFQDVEACDELISAKDSFKECEFMAVQLNLETYFGNHKDKDSDEDYDL
jgi:hypothetical protein